MAPQRITGAWRPLPAADVRRTVLIVDSDEEARAAMCATLAGRGYDVIAVATATAARAAMAGSQRPDATVMAWELPEEPGLALLARWQQDPDLRWVPTLMLSAVDDPTRVQLALDGGAADVLRKPPDIIEFDARLRNALRLRDLQEQMRYIAQRDSLTGIWNRHVGLDRLARLLTGEGSVPALSVSVALIDIDHFKRINDTYGHDAGDDVLVAVASHLEAAFGSVGSVCRHGGEEFLVVLRDLSAEDAAVRVDAARAAMARRAIRASSREVPVDFSAGIAEAVCGAGVKAFDIVKRADVALYRAKAEGRGRVALG